MAARPRFVDWPGPQFLGDRLGELHGVARVDKIAFLPATVNGTPVLVLARTVALVARITGALWTLATLTFVVAALGAANTLMMNVLEQARALSVLRGLGMTAGQIRRMVLTQAALLGLASLGPGTAAGVGLAWVLIRAANAVSGQEAAFIMDLPLTVRVLRSGNAGNNRGGVASSLVCPAPFDDPRLTDATTGVAGRTATT